MSKRAKYVVVMVLVVIVVIFSSIFLAIYYNSVKHELEDRASLIEQEWEEIKVLLDDRYTNLSDMQDTIGMFSVYQADSINYIIKKRGTGSVTMESIADRKYREYMENIEVSCPEVTEWGNYRNHKEELTEIDKELDVLIEKYDNDVMDYNDFKDSFPRNIMAYFCKAEKLYILRYN